MQELKELTDDILKKSSRLVGKYRGLARENISLKTKNKELRYKIDILEAKIKEQSETIVKLQLSKAVENAGNSKGMKLKLNELVREIDRCLRLLND